MRPRRVVAVLHAALASMAIHAAGAQALDSVPFHRGQWGANFLIGPGFSGAGVLRFTSPTRAQLLDASATYSHASNQAGTNVSEGNSVSGSLRLGIRTYRPLDLHLYRWTTLGISLNYNWQRSTQDTLSQSTRGVGAGVFANIGASWLITPHIGVGALWEASLSYSHNKGGGYAGSETSEGVNLSLARVVLAGQLYF
jgi:hypothetical protein